MISTALKVTVRHRRNSTCYSSPKCGVTQLKFDEPKGYAIFGSYTALVYTMPMFGGLIADRFLGYRRSIMFGGILMAIGHLILALPKEWSFFMVWLSLFVETGFLNRIFQVLSALYIPKTIQEKIAGFPFFILE